VSGSPAHVSTLPFFLFFLSLLFQHDGLVWTAGLSHSDFSPHPCRVGSGKFSVVLSKVAREKGMHERRGRLSITFGRLGRSRGPASPSAVSPKSPESSPRLQARAAANTSHVTISPSTPALPPTSTPNRPREVQRVMTEPLRPPLPAPVVARPRSISYPSHPTSRVGSSLPVRPPTSPTNTTAVPQGRFRWLMTSVHFTKRSKRKPSNAGSRKHFGLILALMIFCLTAIVCTYSPPLAASID